MTSSEREFLAACDENGISKLTTAFQKEKAKLIAKQKGVGSWDNVDYLTSLLETHAREEQEKKDAEHRAELQKLKAKELEKKAELEKYAGLHGREKPKRYYTDLIAEADVILKKQKEAEDAAKSINAVYDALAKSVEPVRSPRERDWAIAGGIASGLAGPAAGIAVASEIQRQNAANRVDPAAASAAASAHRAALYDRGAVLSQQVMENAGVDRYILNNARKAKEDCTKLRDASEIKLLDESVDSSKLLSLLNPTILSLKTSASEGTVTVTLGIEGHIVPIFESTPAVVDGWFSCLILNHAGEYCGLASFVLPVSGAESDMELTGIAELYGEPDDNYTLVFAYADLWLVETGDDKQPESIDFGTLSSSVDKNAAAFRKALKISEDNSADSTQLKEAYTLFDSLNNWAGAARFAEKCSNRIPAAEHAEQRKAEQERLAAEKEAEEERLAAEKAEKEQITAKRKKTIIRSAAIVVAAAIIIGFVANLVITKVIIPSNKYNSAVALMENGDYISAYEALGNLNGYKDSAELQASIKSNYKAALLSSATVGDTVLFGSYEQDNNTSNGKEDIEWIVLDTEADSLLVISKYALDMQVFNTSKIDNTWESCSLRSWLNGTFFNMAYNSEEAAKIETTNITTDNNPHFGTDGGNDTQDQVFLLSITDTEKYFSSAAELQCKATAYAEAQGVYSCGFDGDAYGYCTWWLRSPGMDDDSASFCDDYGNVSLLGSRPNYKSFGIRPAMWISLE